MKLDLEQIGVPCCAFACVEEQAEGSSDTILDFAIDHLHNWITVGFNWSIANTIESEDLGDCPFRDQNVSSATVGEHTHHIGSASIETMARIAITSPPDASNFKIDKDLFLNYDAYFKFN